MEGVEQQGCGDVRVLIIPPVMERNTDALFSTLENDFKADLTIYTIRPLPRKPNSMVDFELLVEKCRQVIDTECITVLYANKPLGSLVQAILCQEFPSLRGPSAESIFLCNHKYYTTTMIDQRDKKLPYLVQDLDGDVFDIAYNILQTFVKPGIVRLCLGSGTSVYCFHNRDQLIKVLLQSKQDAYHLLSLQQWLLGDTGANIDMDRYPLTTRPLILINPYLSRFMTTGGIGWYSVGIEACVFQRSFIPWAMCNVVFLPYGSRNPTHSFSGFEMPTSLPGHLQDITWLEFTRDVNELIKHGFTDSFIHGEYMVFENGYVHLVSLNGRVQAKCTNIYNKGLVNGDNQKAALEIAQGIEPQTPEPNGSYVLTYSMAVFDSGKADQLIDFDKALSNPDIVLYYRQGQDIVIEPDKDFAALGTITVTEENFEKCIEKIKEIRTEILKLPELVPLTC